MAVARPQHPIQLKAIRKFVVRLTVSICRAGRGVSSATFARRIERASPGACVAAKLAIALARRHNVAALRRMTAVFSRAERHPPIAMRPAEPDRKMQ